MSINKIVATALAVIFVIFGIITTISSSFDVGADEIVVIQTPSGKQFVWSTPGWRWAFFGKQTVYKKSDQYSFNFNKDADGAEQIKDCISTRFNDQGSAMICGTLSYDLPTDEATMIALHNKFRSQDGVEERLVKAAVVKAIYNSGPLMSSKESAGQGRSDLIRYIQDQSTRGIYETVSRDEEVPDLFAPPIEYVELREVPVLDDRGIPKMDGEKPIMEKRPVKLTKPGTKKITIVQPKTDAKGNIIVQEASTVTELGIKLYNITLERIKYEDKVQTQIDNQRDMEMAVQTKIAEAKKAQQDAITAAESGKAAAATAKWAQEVEKAKAITEVEQRMEVAQKDLEAAKLEKKAKIERAEGDAEARKLVMLADGALDKKLQAWVEVQKAYADQIGKQRWVPEIQMGASSGGNTAAELMQLWQVKAAKDLNLDMRQR
jgi:hypothetical protein